MQDEWYQERCPCCQLQEGRTDTVGTELTREFWVVLGAQGGGWSRVVGGSGLTPGMEQGRGHRWRGRERWACSRGVGWVTHRNGWKNLFPVEHDSN